MSPPASVAEAYAQCEALTRRQAANFYYGIRLLPRERRRAIGVAALRMPILATEAPASQLEFIDSVGHAQFDILMRREREAEEKFQALLTQYPKRPELHHLHGVFLLSSDLKKAMEELQKEIEISPRHVPALHQRSL